MIKSILIGSLLLISILMFSPRLLSQELNSHNQAENGFVAKNKDDPKNALGVFTGTTIVPTQIGSDQTKEILFVPTYGLEYARKVNKWLGLGIHNEFELQTYVISNQEGEEIDRSYIYVGSVLAIFIPIPHLALFMGPGYEISSDHNFRVFKVGAEYAMYRGNGSGWYIAPEVSVDWISTIYQTFSFGIAIGKGF